MNKIHKDVNAEIEKYYSDSTFFYRYLWANKKNLAMHMGFWDNDTKNLNDALLNENRYVADKLDIKNGDKVLDAGCGIGGTAIWITENYRVSVTGITITGKHIVLAEKYAQGRGVSGLTHFKNRDFCDTGFKSESFDKIYGIESICYAEDKYDFLKEAFRLLKKGGKLVVCDGFLIENKLTPEQKRDITDVNVGWALSTGFSYYDSFKDNLIRSGYRNIEFIDVTEKVLRSCKDIYQSSKFIHPVVAILEKLHLTSKSNVLAELACQAQYRMFKDGVVIYGVFVAEK